ncbi:MAG: rhomboid family intramembrane serine protease [Saprospiraceae bacterium]|nr:rhomboid family intramembrane serine protease [Saprospiraceae bacterium]
MIDGNTLMTLSLILANVALYFITSANPKIMDACKHYPYLEKQDKSYYRWLLSGFMHANLMHLFLNLFVLYQFGGTVEAIFKGRFGFLTGGVFFLLTYFMILILSGIPTYIKHQNNRRYASVGASGVISGILFIYILYFPTNLLFILGLVPIPAFLFGILYLYFSKWASGRYDDMIDHDAHYYGALAGLLAGITLKFIF